MSSQSNTKTIIKTSYPDLSDRQNPEFKQTAQKYLLNKKQRKQLEKRKSLLSNQVNHFLKLNTSLEKSLQQKQHQLRWLKQVRQRYLTSIENKKQRDEQEKRKILQLKMENTHMRQKSIQNIHDALDQLHRKKSKAHNDVLNSLQGLKHRYSLKQSAIDEANHSMYLSIRKSRVKGKNRVNKFFQKKNTELTRHYKSMAREEEETFISGVREIEMLQEKESRYKEKMLRKEGKLSKIMSEIEELKVSSQQIALEIMRSSRHGGTVFLNQSKVTKNTKTERMEDESKKSNQVGFKLMSIGSKQFIDGNQIV